MCPSKVSITNLMRSENSLDLESENPETRGKNKLDLKSQNLGGNQAQLLGFMKITYHYLYQADEDTEV